jgi:hypothetical protein
MNMTLERIKTLLVIEKCIIRTNIGFVFYLGRNTLCHDVIKKEGRKLILSMF